MVVLNFVRAGSLHRRDYVLSLAEMLLKLQNRPSVSDIMVSFDRHRHIAGLIYEIHYSLPFRKAIRKVGGQSHFIAAPEALLYPGRIKIVFVRA